MFRWVQAASSVEPLFLLAARGRAIVGGTTSARTLPAMMPSATEGTTQVDTFRVAGIGQELDPAVSAVRQTPAQLRLCLQNRLERGSILTDERIGAVILVPIRPKRENFL